MADAGVVRSRTRGRSLSVPGWRQVAVTYGAVAVLLFLVANLAYYHLPVTVPEHGFPDYDLFNLWTRWDSDWYQHIVNNGYFYAGPSQQSSVAFFPAYPAAMRVVDAVVGNALVAGVIVSFAAGVVAAYLFSRFCRAAFGERAGRVGLLVLLLYPFSLYLFGIVYSDALFLASALAAFLLLEHDRPVLAGLAGALATAGRPIGLAVLAGLALRSMELRGVLPGGPPRLDGSVPGAAVGHRTPLVPWPVRLSRLQARDAGVVLAAAGFVTFVAYLQNRFGEPFAFARVQNADGWGWQLDGPTFVKREYFRFFSADNAEIAQFILSANAAMILLALVLVPLAVRRLGWAYGVYAFAVLAFPAVTSPTFIATGRHALAGFPVFAVAAGVLAHTRHRWICPVWLAGSGAVAVTLTSFWGRWYLL